MGITYLYNQNWYKMGPTEQACGSGKQILLLCMLQKHTLS
jgi:hypothetical protein